MRVYYLPPKTIERNVADPGEGPDLLAHRSFLRVTIKKALQVLSARRASTLIWAFGLEGSYSYSCEEIGRIQKVSREYARAVFACSLRLLSYPRFGLQCFVDED
jgi:DNA-directed RNA polymerase sigma subunit (sigma70/sigma32)